MNRLKKILFIFLFIGICLIINSTKSEAGYQKFNLIDYQAYINYDGSMSVIETWDIYISDTNTIFKNFKLDNNKYSGITDVKVSDITFGKKELKQIYEEMYHVTKDCYYALDIGKNKFEIAWGVGLENRTATKKYRIEYIVQDAIAKYNDCSELYWKFMGEDNAIEAEKLTGVIYLPTRVNSKDDIKVWGHTKGINGEIYVTDLDKVEFRVEGLKTNNYVEARICMPKDIVSGTGRTYNQNMMETILKEEKKWAEEANLKRTINMVLKVLVVVALIIAMGVIIIILIIKIKKYTDMLKQTTKIIKPSQDIKYFREIPRENASPGEAKFLSMKNRFSFLYTELGDIFSATILNLFNENYIDIRNDKEDKNNTSFIFKVAEKKIQNIKNNDEKMVYDYLVEASQNKQELTLKDLQKYIKKYPAKIEKLQKGIETEVKRKLYDNGYINKQEEDKMTSTSTIKMIYIILPIILLGFGIPISIVTENIIFIPFILMIFILSIICVVKVHKLMEYINIYSQEAVDEIEMWKGLKKFMEELSQIDKKEIPEVVLWEKYLVYATAFGIADKVLKQLKLVYPDFENVVNMSASTHMALILNSNINNTISSSIKQSISSAYSSASGGGGGFSGGGGGGGGRRWLRRKINRINKKEY